jgi:tetratricopeptide (TPR) repeat protein
MRIAVILFLLVSFCTVKGQKQGLALADSLERALTGAKEDTQQVQRLVSLSRVWDGIEPRKGFEFAGRGLELAQKISYQQGVANLNNCLGLLTGDTGNNAQARVYFEKSLAINKTLGSRNNEIANLSNLGRSYERETNFTKASEYYFQGLSMALEAGNNEQAALVGTNILAMYIEEQDYQKALSYADSTIKWATAGHAPIHLAKAYEMEGVIYVETKDTPRARRNFDTAIVLYKKLGNKIAMVAALSNLATLEADPLKQIAITQQAQAILDSVAP